MIHKNHNSKIMDKYNPDSSKLKKKTYRKNQKNHSFLNISVVALSQKTYPMIISKTPNKYLTQPPRVTTKLPDKPQPKSINSNG